MSIDAYEFLETVAGERCPCGHLVSDHDGPGGTALPDATLECCGPCRRCMCRGLLERA